MKIIKFVLITLSLSVCSSEAVTLNLGKEVKHCLTLPAYGDNVKTQEQCRDEAKALSEKSLNETISRIHAAINDDYDTPYHLNDMEGVKIKDVFWEKFSNAQKLWLSSRNEMCAASASLVGEWATSQGDIQTQCIIDQNKNREQLLKATYLK